MRTIYFFILIFVSLSCNNKENDIKTITWGNEKYYDSLKINNEGKVIYRKTVSPDGIVFIAKRKHNILIGEYYHLDMKLHSRCQYFEIPIPFEERPKLQKIGRCSVYYETGELSTIHTWDKQGQTGPITYFYKNGNIQQTGFFRFYAKDSLWLTFSKKGKLKKMELYRKDSLIEQYSFKVNALDTINDNIE